MAIKIWNPDTESHDVSYEGAVLGTYERNGYDDSDFIAVVWDEERQAVRTVEYASTSSWSYNNGAKEDATPAVLKKAEAWALEYAAKLVRMSHSDVTVGSQVKSLTTHGKAKGLTGEVEHVMKSKHDSAWAARYNPTMIAKVVNKTTGEYAWVPVTQLEVTSEPDEAEVLAEARTLAQNNGPVGLAKSAYYIATKGL